MPCGFIGALTGGNANLGINIQHGAELAIDQCNEKNPDCKVTLTSYDSQGSTDQSPALAKKAIDDKAVVGIIGPAFSGESRAANPLLERGRPPAHHAIGHRRRPVDQRVEGLPPRARHRRRCRADGAAKYIKDTLAAKSVFVIDDQSDYGKGLADQVKTSLGDLVKGTDKTQDKQTDFSAVVSAVKACESGRRLLRRLLPEAGLFLKQLRDAGVTAQVRDRRRREGPGFRRRRR